MHIWKALACLQTLFFFKKKIQQCSFIFSFPHPQPLVVSPMVFISILTNRQSYYLKEKMEGLSPYLPLQQAIKLWKSGAQG